MPGLLPGSVVRESEAPPHSAVQKIMTGTDGDLWFLESATLRRFHLKRSTWETLENQAGERTTSFIVDSEHLVAAGNINLVEIGIQDTAIRHGLTNDRHRTNMIVTVAECNRLEQELRTNGSNRYICSVSGGEQSPNGALAIQNLRNHRWQHLEDSDGFPNPPTTLTLDGDNLWVGGEGVIALVDLKAGKVRKFSHIKAETVERIEIAGGYLWAQFDWHLYRAPLSAVQ
jgi:ligand-binding sensor domain-containing protein